MSKLIRFDEEHFGYLTEHDFSLDEAERMKDVFAAWWPGKRLIVVQAEEFIDLTGQYEVIPVVELPPLTQEDYERAAAPDGGGFLVPPGLDPNFRSRDPA